MSGFTSLGAAARFAALSTVGALVLASCGGTGDPPAAASPSTVGAGSAPDVSVGTAPPDVVVTSPAALPDGPIAAVIDPVVAGPDIGARALAAGFDEPTAELMALTESTVAVVDAHTFVVHHALPTGATADVTYQLVAASDMSPGEPPEFTSEIVGDEFHFTMQYAISADDLPADVRAQVGDALPARPAGFRSTAGAASVIGVVVSAEISQGVETAADAFVDHLESKGYKKPGKGWGAYKAGKKVSEALDANEIIANALKELEAIKKCAKNPTNPITKKAYKENPQEQQDVLDQLTAIEVDIKANAAVMFTTMLADTAGGLIKVAPWLGFITAPANNYVQDTLTKLVKDRLGEARRRASCTPVKYSANGGGGISITGTIADIEKPFALQGAGVGFTVVLSFTPSSATAGTLSYSGGGGGAGLAGSGTYTISQSGNDTLTIAYTTGGCADIGTCKERAGTITLTPLKD